MTLVQFCISTDCSAIGRVNATSLNQQTRMELLVEHVEAENIFIDEGEARDVHDWPGVSCGDDGSVCSIDWSCMDLLTLRGTIRVEWLPQTIRLFDVSLNRLAGEIPTATLPNELRIFNAQYNDFSGTLCLSTLPPQLQVFRADHNRLTGSVCLESLLQTLEQLFLDDNRFEGEVCLTRLPARLFKLWLKENRLCGELNFSALPEKLTELFLSKNNFSGSVSVDSLPPTMEILDVSQNCLRQETLKVKSFPESLWCIDFSGNAIGDVVDGEGKPILSWMLKK